MNRRAILTALPAALASVLSPVAPAPACRLCGTTAAPLKIGLLVVGIPADNHVATLHIDQTHTVYCCPTCGNLTARPE